MTPLNEALNNFNTSLSGVKTDSAANLAALQAIIDGLIDDDVITTEFDAVLTDLTASDAALQGLRVPTVPTGIQYVNTVLNTI